jgi:hypothetical protein
MIRYLALGTLVLAAPYAYLSAQDANRDQVYTRTDAAVITQSLDKRTDDFKDEFDKAISHSLLNGTKLEDRAKHRADDLHEAAKKLRDVYHDKKDKNNPAVRERVDKTLAAAADVNQIMTQNRFTDKLQRDWDLLRSDLNALAGIYALAPL